MEPSRFFVIYILVLFFIIQCSHCSPGSLVVPIGVVLDLNSPLGLMADLCMNMAVEDFYAAHSNYSTRLQLQTRNAGSVLDANFAALGLLEHEKVHGIIGPQESTEETFIVELGQQVHVPIVSFTSRISSSLSYAKNHYFVKTTPDDDVQTQALAAICRGFEWPEVVVLYEDTYYGNRFISYLNKAFQEVEIRLAYMIAIPSSADNSHILEELNKLATRQTRVFLVHVSPSLGFRLFNLAKKIGVLSEGYAWLITDSLSIFMNSMDSVTRDSMEGVLGIRPYVPSSNDLKGFEERWKRNATLKNTRGPIMELNVYGLWAYDMITALATAMEKIAPINSTLFEANTPKINGTDKSNLIISAFGPRLLNELSSTKFRGLSGDFELVERKLKLSAFKIFNMIGSGEKTVGFWMPDRGIVRDMISVGETNNYSTSTKELKSVLWPGDSVTRPKGLAIPTTRNLKVGVPWKHGFTEFVDVIIDPKTKHINATGFSIDIFLATLELLPFPIDYKFLPYNDTKNIDWSYDDMLHEIPQKFDMVVGDTTVWAPRAAYVEFSLPYSEPGVVLVVKNTKPFDMWIFIKPLRWDLWLAIIVACILMGIVVRILEHRVASNGAGSGTNKEQSKMVYWSPIVVLAFPERNMVSNKWSFLVLVFWLFMAFILMQSYTANLAAILTVDQLKFAFSDNYNIGFQEGSFMKEFLTKQLHISASRLRSYSSAEEYHNAMSLGSKNGGIDAIFDEIPYMKIFLNKYDSQYKMVGPTYRTGGFGFAFPVGSRLTAHFSKAILDVTQGPNMTAIEQKNFGPGYSSQDPLSSKISQQTSSLTFFEFAGLFLIVGSITIFSLFCSETTIGRKLTIKMGYLIHNCSYFRISTFNSVEDARIHGNSIQSRGEDNHESVHDDGGAPSDSHVIEEESRHCEEVNHVTDLNTETTVA